MGTKGTGSLGQVTSAWRKGRVDAVVQSTDKNFMVPVGGAVVAAGIQDVSLVTAVNKVVTHICSTYQLGAPVYQAISGRKPLFARAILHNVWCELQAYPGRASMTPLLDVLITLLQWGVSGWRNVLEQREALYR